MWAQLPGQIQPALFSQFTLKVTQTPCHSSRGNQDTPSRRLTATCSVLASLWAGLCGVREPPAIRLLTPAPRTEWDRGFRGPLPCPCHSTQHFQFIPQTKPMWKLSLQRRQSSRWADALGPPYEMNIRRRIGLLRRRREPGNHIPCLPSLDSSPASAQSR